MPNRIHTENVLGKCYSRGGRDVIVLGFLFGWFCLDFFVLFLGFILFNLSFCFVLFFFLAGGRGFTTSQLLM